MIKTFCRSHSGLSSGRGSTSNTSRAAPLMRFSRSAACMQGLAVMLSSCQALSAFNLLRLCRSYNLATTPSQNQARLHGRGAMCGRLQMQPQNL